MNPFKLLHILPLLGLLLTSNLALAAEIVASLDRNPVNLSDSFQLTFTASEEPDAEPDFSPLQDDFDILNQQRSSNASWINGKRSRNEQWTLTLMARRPGNLTIASIRFGQDSSNPLQLTVTNKQSEPQSGDDLFLEVEASPEKPYVQSQLLYTVRLYLRVSITHPELSQPEAPDAVVEKLGEDSSYQTQVNGVPYTVVERKYAIFPQQSGVLTIPPVVLTADVVSSQQPRFNSFFNPQVTKTRRINSKPVIVEVLPAPKDADAGQWLVADSLTLKQSWSSDKLQIQVGEPLTRTLSITAQGTTVGQLPELIGQSTIDGLKLYPDQPVLKETKSSDGLTAFREEKIALIASKPGDFQLPPLEIRWFNNKTRQMETARLPGATVKVLGNPSSNPAPSVAPPNPGIKPSQQATAPIAETTASTSTLWIWQALSAFLASGWLLTVIWFKHGSLPKQQTPKPIRQTQGKDDAGKALKLACQAHQAQAAKQALLQWGKQHYACDNLTALAEYCQPPLNSEISRLNQHLYAQQSQAWNGDSLWLAFKSQQPNDKTKTDADDGLEPLFRI